MNPNSPELTPLQLEALERAYGRLQAENRAAEQPPESLLRTFGKGFADGVADTFGTVKDSIYATPAGVARAALGVPGTVGDLHQLYLDGAAWTERRLRGETPDQYASRVGRGLNTVPQRTRFTTTDQFTNNFDNSIGQYLPRAKTEAGKFVERTIELSPAIVSGGAKNAAAFYGGVVAPTIAGHLAHQYVPDEYKNGAAVLASAASGYAGPRTLHWARTKTPTGILAESWTPDAPKRMTQLGRNATLADSNKQYGALGLSIAERPGDASEMLRKGFADRQNEAKQGNKAKLQGYRTKFEPLDDAIEAAVERAAIARADERMRVPMGQFPKEALGIPMAYGVGGLDAALAASGLFGLHRTWNPAKQYWQRTVDNAVASRLLSRGTAAKANFDRIDAWRSAQSAIVPQALRAGLVATLLAGPRARPETE